MGRTRSVSCTSALLVVTVCASVVAGGQIAFPADSGVVDVTKAPYLAKGDGKADDTAALQKALDDHPNQGAIIFLPAGTYRISDTLRWPAGAHGGNRYKRTVLHGAGTKHTVIQLPDRCPGFSRGAARGPRYVADVPGPFVLDPATGRTRPNQTSLRFDTGKDARGEWHRDMVAVRAGQAGQLQSFTVEGFLRPGSEAPHQWATILACASLRDPYQMPWGLDVELWNPGAVRKLRVKLRPRGYAFIQSRSATSPTLTAPGWHHFAYTYDAAAGAARLYWDYKLAHSVDVPDPARHPLAYAADAAIQLGGIHGKSPGWNGLLDEIRLSRGVLAPGAFLRAVAKPAQAAGSTRPSPAVGYWRLEGTPGAMAVGEVASEVDPRHMNGRGGRAGSGAGEGKPMLWTGGRPAQRFSNGVKHLTLDTGRGNDLAVGAQFMANNQGSFREVTIRSRDGGGRIGLDLGYDDEQGPCLVKNVTIEGFAVGIRLRHAVNSVTFEHITLSGQTTCGIRNDGQVINLRGLRSVNAVPAIRNGRNPSMLTLVDSVLVAPVGGRGPKPAVAVENHGLLFARNVLTRGFAQAITNTDGLKKGHPDGQVVEFTSHAPVTLFPGPAKSLNLPVKETPLAPWDPPEQWVSPTHYGAKVDTDISAALQKAIDAGKTTVYIPRGRYKIGKTVLIRGAVRRIVGCRPWLNSASSEGPMFRLVDGAADVVVFEGVSGGYQRRTALEHASKRTLVVRECCNFGVTQTGGGDLFIEDVCANPFTRFEFGPGNVWARQINPEFREGTHLVNRGGTVWILGMKVEAGNTMIETTDAGRTELLGGFCYANIGPKGAPMFIVRDSALSLTVGEAFFNPRTTSYLDLVRETRGTETRILKKGQVPPRCGGSAIPLFVARPGG